LQTLFNAGRPVYFKFDISLLTSNGILFVSRFDIFILSTGALVSGSQVLGLYDS